MIETARGWLMLYHGVRRTAAGCLYRLGAALLDLERPEQCLLRGDSWIVGPEAPYEREGDVGYVTFPCGYTLSADPPFPLCYIRGSQGSNPGAHAVKFARLSASRAGSFYAGKPSLCLPSLCLPVAART